jgi:NAD(P)-dependent dehydrogenase (short-subunit alcohol dehydrogenase family)
MNRLTGKYGLITRASQGLGLQMTISYAQEGAAGIAIVARGAELLEKARYLVHAASPTTKDWRSSLMSVSLKISKESSLLPSMNFKDIWIF